MNIDSIANELQERLSRSTNILIFNLDEENGSETDFNRVLQILVNACVNNRNFQVRRIGRAARDRPCALVVQISSRQEVLQVLRNRRAIPAHLSISEDRTRDQRASLNEMRRQIQEHNRAHPNNLWRIKYVNGAPTIVSAVDQTPVQKNM